MQTGNNWTSRQVRSWVRRTGREFTFRQGSGKHEETKVTRLAKVGCSTVTTVVEQSGKEWSEEPGYLYCRHLLLDEIC